LLTETAVYWKEFCAHLTSTGTNMREITGRIDITDAPPDLLLRGLYPTETCQSTRAGTSNNEAGQLVNPIRFGQFRLANLVEVNGDTERITARLLIEVTPTSYEDVALLTDNLYDGGDPLAAIVLKQGVRHYVRTHLQLDPAHDLYFLDEREPVTADGEVITPIAAEDFFAHAELYRDYGIAH